MQPDLKESPGLWTINPKYKSRIWLPKLWKDWQANRGCQVRPPSPGSGHPASASLYGWSRGHRKWKEGGLNFFSMIFKKQQCRKIQTWKRTKLATIMLSQWCMTYCKRRTISLVSGRWPSWTTRKVSRWKSMIAAFVPGTHSLCSLEMLTLTLSLHFMLWRSHASLFQMLIL